MSFESSKLVHEANAAVKPMGEKKNVHALFRLVAKQFRAFEDF